MFRQISGARRFKREAPRDRRIYKSWTVSKDLKNSFEIQCNKVPNPLSLCPSMTVTFDHYQKLLFISSSINHVMSKKV